MMTDIVVPQLGDPDHEDTTRLIVCWCILWVVVHHLAWPLWKCRRVVPLIFSPTPVERYRRRLCRSQVYCSLAVVGGFRLLLGCRWSAHDLLYAYSDEHQLLFAMAVGHWLVSVWEDLQNWTFLKAGLSANDTKNNVDPSHFLWQAYLVHHLVAALAFAMAMRMRVCTGLAAFGLIFELPVLFMNQREFIVIADAPVEWFQDIRQVKQFWNTLKLCWFFARTVPTLVYFYSLIFWSEDLSKLSHQAAWTYNGMAIFFSVLNFALTQTFLAAWRKKDFDVAESRSKEDGVVYEQQAQEKEREVEAGHEADAMAPDLPEVAKRQLGKVTREQFASKTAGEDGLLWLEVDDIVYDLTEFVGKHPGGDAILRKFAGKDASKAFHKAKHSMQAKMQMQMYCVGHLVKEMKVYRMFEHSPEVSQLVNEFRQLAVPLVAVCWMLPNSYFPNVRSLKGEAPALSQLLLPGLAFSLASSVLLLFGRGLPESGRFNPANWPRNAIYFAMSLTAFFLGLELARRPVQGNWPSGLEIGSVMIFLVEEVLVHMHSEGWKFLYWRRNTLAGALMILSWNMRGAGGLDLLCNEHLLGGVLIGISVPMLCRLSSTKQEVMLDEFFQGLALSSVFCLPCFLYLVAPETDRIRTLVLHAWASWTINTLMLGCASSIAALLFVILLLYQAGGASSQLASRMVALMLSMAILFRSGFSSWRWLTWIAWFTMIGTLGLRQVAVHDELQKKGKLAEVGKAMIAARATSEQFYMALAALTWQALRIPIAGLINELMPQELQFYASWFPFFELGQDVDVGVAAYYAPEKALASKDGPQHFVCSVRHMDTAHPEGQRDLQLQRNTAREMWMKCKDTSVGGLVANVNCFFPRLSGSTHCKEINLSGWVSSEAADAWSEKHFGLPGFQSQSSRGQMRTMGSMQAILKPHGEIRHQDRCSGCARLSESETLGEKAPERCKYCGKKNYGYPFF